MRLFRTDVLHPRCFYNRAGGLGLSMMMSEHAIYRVNGWDRCMRVIRTIRSTSGRIGAVKLTPGGVKLTLVNFTTGFDCVKLTA